MLRKLLGIGKNNTAHDEPVGLPRRADMSPMDAGPIATFSFNYERLEGGQDITDSEYVIDNLLTMFGDIDARASFQCPARMAEVAPASLVKLANAGHEIVCQGYHHESADELEGPKLAGILQKCREVMSKRSIPIAGYHPTVPLKNVQAYQMMSRSGFRFITELSREDNPRLLVPPPKPLLRMPIASNDSGYKRHSDDRKHVLNKHTELMQRLIRKQHYLALNYHIYMLGEVRERLDDVRRLLELALTNGVQIRTFGESLPAAYRPPAEKIDTES